MLWGLSFSRNAAVLCCAAPLFLCVPKNFKIALNLPRTLHTGMFL